MFFTNPPRPYSSDYSLKNDVGPKKGYIRIIGKIIGRAMIVAMCKDGYQGGLLLYPHPMPTQTGAGFFTH